MSEFIFSNCTSPLEAALDYASRGIPVFPVYFVPEESGIKGKKRPLVPMGYKAATTEPTEIKSWWESWPDAMISIPTGIVSNIFVVDLDGEDGLRNWRVLAEELGFDPDETTCEKSPGGMHYFYSFPIDAPKKPCCTTSKLCGGIDTKGENGSIVVSPSFYKVDRGYGEKPVEGRYEIIRNGGIKPLPTVLLDQILKFTTIESSCAKISEVTAFFAEKNTEYGERLLKQCCAKISNAQPTERNAILFLQAKRVGEYIAGGQINERIARERFEAALQSGLDKGEIESTCASGFSFGFNNPKKPPVGGELPDVSPVQDEEKEAEEAEEEEKEKYEEDLPPW